VISTVKAYHRSRTRSLDARPTQKLDNTARRAHDALVPPRAYHSPLTGNVWTDARPAIGTLAGLANYLNERRPRRKPPEGHDAAIALATNAAGAIAGIPRITRAGEVEGRVISDAYWQAKDAKVKLTPIVDDGWFLQHQEWQGEDWLRHQNGEQPYYQEKPVVTLSIRAARLAWYAANLTEKVAANGAEVDSYSYAHHATLGTLVELHDAGIDKAVAAGVERVWRFVVAAGRMPVLGVDDDLLAAFEAALMAGEDSFATHLAKHGWGQVTTTEP
jgi:hypothetical protein